MPDPAELLDALERHGCIGTWRWVEGSEEMEWSDNFYRLLGFQPGERPATVALSMERLTDADAEALRAELDRAPRDGPSAVASYRVILPDGRLRLLEARPDGGWRRDQAGQRILAGTIRDVTEETVATRARAWHRVVAELSCDQGLGEPERALAALALALGAPAAALWAVREGVLELAGVGSEPGLPAESLAPSLEALDEPGDSRILAGALDSGEVLVAGPTRGGGALPDGLRPVVAVPVLDDGCVSGVVAVYASHPLEGAELLQDDLAASRAVLGERLRLCRRSPLTAREVEVLALAADGLAGHEIERRLLLSRSTVKSHFENIYAKLGVSNRPAAVACALRGGLIE